MSAVIVTGGAGYVGSHACKALALAGYLPVVYDNLSTGNRWAVRYGPLEIGDVLDSAPLHEVIQAVPRGGSHAFRRLHTGRRVHAGARALLPDQCCRDAQSLGHRTHDIGAIVFSSSCATYGMPEGVPITEDAPQRPVTPYGASKLMAERALADYEMSYGLRYACLRYFNAAGADPAGEVGEHRAVELLAGGHSLRLNLGTGRDHSVREVISCAERVTGRPVPHRVAPRREGDPPELVADPSRSIALLRLELRHSRTLEEIVASA